MMEAASKRWTFESTVEWDNGLSGYLFEALHGVGGVKNLSPIERRIATLIPSLSDSVHCAYVRPMKIFDLDIARLEA